MESGIVSAHQDKLDVSVQRVGEELWPQYPWSYSAPTANSALPGEESALSPLRPADIRYRPYLLIRAATPTLTNA
jgi:hypothetical protein